MELCGDDDDGDDDDGFVCQAPPAPLNNIGTIFQVISFNTGCL